MFGRPRDWPRHRKKLTGEYSLTAGLREPVRFLPFWDRRPSPSLRRRAFFMTPGSDFLVSLPPNGGPHWFSYERAYGFLMRGLLCHCRTSGNPEFQGIRQNGIPACAGMTRNTGLLPRAGMARGAIRRKCYIFFYSSFLVSAGGQPVGVWNSCCPGFERTLVFSVEILLALMDRDIVPRQRPIHWIGLVE